MHVWFYDSHGALYHVSHVLIWRCRRECRWRDVAPSLASLCCKEHVYVRLFFTFRRRQESASNVSIYDEISSSLSSSGEPRWLTEWLVASLPAIFLIPPPPLAIPPPLLLADSNYAVFSQTTLSFFSSHSWHAHVAVRLWGRGSVTSIEKSTASLSQPHYL